MNRIRWHSVRVRLTLWNVVVLALLLAGSGIVLCYGVQVDLAGSMDAGLARAARQFAAHLPPLGQDGRSTDLLRRGRPPFPLRRLSRAAAVRDMDLQRPQHLTVDGRPLDPMGRDTPWDMDALARSTDGRPRFSTIPINGEPVRVYTLPIRGGAGQVEGVIQWPRPSSDLERLSQRQVRTLLMLIPFALLVAGLFGIFLTDRTLRPVRMITQIAGEIGAEDLSQRLEVTGEDEFAELAATFNGMISRLQEAFQRVEKAYEQQRRFTGDASHELRTPLTFIKGRASLALREPRSAEEYRQALQGVNQAADLMNSLIQDLLLLARADAEHLQLDCRPLDLATLFSGAAATLPAKAADRLRVELPDEPLAVPGHLDSLVRLLTNLIENAVRHTPADGQITLSAHAQGAAAVIRVADTGEGIPPEHLPHVCERFYRVDAGRARSQGGTGLGLAICESIAQAHGGTLEIESVVGQGTTVSITLPRAPSSLASPAEAGVGAEPLASGLHQPFPFPPVQAGHRQQ